jgi:hypothetical protein
MRALQHEHWAFTLFAVPSLGAISASAFVPWVQHKAAWDPRGDLRIPNTGCTGTRNRVSDLARWSSERYSNPRTLTLTNLMLGPHTAPLQVPLYHPVVTGVSISLPSESYSRLLEGRRQRCRMEPSTASAAAWSTDRACWSCIAPDGTSGMLRSGRKAGYCGRAP